MRPIISQFALRHFVMILFLIGLVGCASTPIKETDYAAMNANLDNGTSSIILGQFIPRDNITHAYFTIKNLNTGKTLPIWLYSSFIISYEVTPGKYMIKDGMMYGAEYRASMPLLPFWFETFDAEAGKIINIGALGYKTVDVQSIQPRTFRKDKNKTMSYVSYYSEPIDQSDLDAFMESKFPMQESRLVNRELKTVLSESQFEDIVKEAGAPDANGVYPTTDESRERVNAAIKKYVVSSTFERLKLESAKQ